MFQGEDETQQAVTKVCILRIIIQMLRMKEEVAKLVADQMIAHS